MLRMRRIREDKGMTLLELSRRTAIHEPDLSLIERGHKPAYPGWQRRISKALRVPAAELFAVEVEDD